MSLTPEPHNSFKTTGLFHLAIPHNTHQLPEKPISPNKHQVRQLITGSPSAQSPQGSHILKTLPLHLGRAIRILRTAFQVGFLPGKSACRDKRHPSYTLKIHISKDRHISIIYPSVQVTHKSTDSQTHTHTPLPTTQVHTHLPTYTYHPFCSYKPTFSNTCPPLSHKPLSQRIHTQTHTPSLEYTHKYIPKYTADM